MKNIKKPFSLLINIFFVGFLVYIFINKFWINRPAKQIDIHQLQIVDLNGQEVDITLFDGKGIFLNFWASWCGPCMMEMPSIANAVNHFKDEDIVFLLVNTQSISDAKSITHKKQFSDLPLYVLKHSGNIEINAIPLTYLIDSKGETKTVHQGVNHWNNPLTRRKIKSLVH